MRVIDGMHRLRATTLRGCATIEVQFVDDGEGPELFVLAVAANIAHGLPLTSADRQAATDRIIRSHPHWSDRVIARATGISTRTVSAIRARAAGELPDQRVRIGRDGKLRPLNGAQGRMLAGEILQADPGSSLRRVAQEAGISLGTAFDVRKRILSGRDPVPADPRGGPQGPSPEPQAQGGTERMSEASRRALSLTRRRIDGRRATHAPTDILKMLMKDPALRYTDSGRVLLRRLRSFGIGVLEWENKVEAVPQHCADAVADYARHVADSWMQFAEQLEQR